MKKGLFFLGLASMMSAFVGCTKDTAEAGGAGNSQNGVVNNPDLVIAMPEGDELTRTMLDATGKNVLWEKGDRIAVFSESTSSFKVRYTLDGEGGMGTGVFKYDPAPGADEAISLYPCGRTGNAGRLDPTKEVYVAVYPYNTPEPYRQKGGQSSDPNFSLGSTIPTEQVYTEGSYDKKALPMIAVFDKNTTKVQFRYLGALLKIPVAGVGVKLTSVKLETVPHKPEGSTSGDLVYPNPSGKVHLYFSSMMNSNPGCKTEADLWNKLTNPAEKWTSEVTGAILTVQSPGLNIPTTLAPEEGTIDLTGTAKPLYFGIAPRNYKEGLIATFYCEDGTEYKKKLSSSSTNVYAGSVVNCPKVVLNTTLYVPVPAINGDVISWTPAASGVESYEIIGRINGLDLFSKTVSGASADIKKLFASNLASLSKDYGVGSVVDVNFVVRVVYTNKENVDAGISKSVVYKYTIPSPTPSIVFSQQGEADYKITLSNAAKFDEAMYAWKPGTKQLADFTDEDFKSFDPTVGVIKEFSNGNNTVVVKAKCVTNKTFIYGIDWEEAIIATIVPEFTVTGKNTLGGYIKIVPSGGATYAKYLAKYECITRKIYWKEGADADMTDLSTATSVDGSVAMDPDFEEGVIYLDNISKDLDKTKTYTFVVVLGGTYSSGEQQGKGNYKPE